MARHVLHAAFGGDDKAIRGDVRHLNLEVPEAICPAGLGEAELPEGVERRFVGERVI